jgi:hypothetical protein
MASVVDVSPPLASPVELKGGKPAWGASYKTSTPGFRRDRRSHGAAPPSPAKADACEVTAKGIAWGRGSVASSRACAGSKPARASSHRQRATRTASAGALIIASARHHPTMVKPSVSL